MKKFLIEKKEKIILIFLALFWLIFSALLFLSLTKPIYIDEGVFLAIGKGIAQGKKMYIDFWDHKTPGIHYLWASLYPLFSTNVILYKIFLWLINFFTAGLLFLISEKVKTGSGKFTAILFLATLVFLEGNYLSAGPFLAFFLVLSAYCLTLGKDKLYLPFLSGVFLALAFIFKQVALLNLPVFIIFFVMTKRYRDLIPFFAGIILPVSVMLLYFYRIDILQEFRQQVFGSYNYPSESLSFRFGKWMETFSRFWWLWLGFIIGIFAKFKERKQKWFYLLLILLPMIVFMRHYPHYWLQVLPFISIFAGVGFVAALRYYEKYPFVYIFLFFIIIASFFQNMLWYKWTTDNLNRPKEKEQEQIVKELSLLDYEKILAENRYTGFYFLSEKDPLTKFLYRTEVNEPLGSVNTTFDALKNKHKIVALWPKDQDLVYSKNIGGWLEENTQKINYYPELDLIIYYKD